MDLRRLKTFRVVARSGSLRHAANQFGLTLPAISIQIKKLEEEVGTSLFHHLPNKLVLTESGRIFVRELDVVFDALERAMAAVAAPNKGVGGSVSLSIGTDISKFFSGRLATFVTENPEASLSIQTRSSSKGLSLLLEREVDLSVGFYRALPRGLKRVPLLTSGFSFVHPRGMDVMSPNWDTEALSTNRLISLSRTSTTRRVIDAVMAEYDIVSPSTVEAGSCQAVLAFVEMGLGVGLVHNICASVEMPKDVGLIDVSHRFGELEVAVAAFPDAIVRPSCRALVETLAGSPMTESELKVS